MLKKRAMTLLEIMIVIFLIGIISSVVGYNMKGSLEKGKVFKTEEAQKQIKDILLLEVAAGSEIDKVIKNPIYYLKKSGLPKNEKDLMKDGWGGTFTLELSSDRQDIVVKSKNLENHKNKNNKNQPTSSQDEDFSF